MSANRKADIWEEREKGRGRMNTCTWTEDADGNWHTGCQEIHVFISGTPHENGYVYCPYCGGKIEKESGK